VPALPPPPDLPETPAQVEDAIYLGLGTAIGPVYTAAIAGMPAYTAGGFALRPACGAFGTANAVEGLGSEYVQVPAYVVIALGPALIMCYGAAQPGPADPVLAQADAAAGPTISEIYESALTTVRLQVLGQVPGLVTSEAVAVCIVPALLGPITASIPPPANRVGPFAVLCG